MSASKQALLLTLALVACGDKDDTGSPPGDSQDSGDTAPDSGDSSPPDTQPPCADGGWGAISPWETAVHVSADGTPEATGTWADPVSDPDAALALLRERGTDKHMAIWPGSYGVKLSLTAASGDSDTVIQGCSAAEVTLEADDASAAVIEIAAATGVSLEGISTRGGTRGIQVWSGAEATLTDLLVEGATEVGLIVHGNSVQASIEGVEVHGGGAGGYGIALQEGATVAMSGGGVFDASTVGLLIDDVADVSLSGITVEGTTQDSAGAYGRGVQVQADSGSVTVQASTFTANQGAGIFAMEVLSLDLTGNTVEATAASSIPGSAATTGDGIVFTRGDGNRDPATFQGSFDSNVISDSARAGIVLDGVTCQVSDNTLSGNVAGDILAQGPADISGSDTYTSLGETEALGLNLEPMATVDPGA
jgi:hypothetical protein